MELKLSRWFNVFTYRNGKWVVTFIPEDEHLWDLLVVLTARN